MVVSGGDVKFVILMHGGVGREVKEESVLFCELPDEYSVIMRHELGGEKPAWDAITTAISKLGALLATDAVEAARKMGDDPHHLEVTITSDPVTVIELGSRHDCNVCRATTKEALDRLDTGKSRWIVITMLALAKPKPPDPRNN